MMIGYARVSTRLQETHLQLDALKKAGVQFIYHEKTSSVGARPELQKVLAGLKPGDVFVVYKIDRIARSLSDLLSIMERITKSGASMRSLTEPIDSGSPLGMFMLQVLGAFAQLEKSIIRERAIAGQVAAIRRGVVIGRPRKLTDEQDLDVYTRFKTGETKASLMRFYNSSNTTIDLAIAKFEPNRRKKRPLTPILGPLLEQ